MARSKRDKKVVVNQAYFELIERKAELLDSIYQYGDGTVTVDAATIKDCEKVAKDWDKAHAGQFAGTEAAYQAPAAK